MQLITTISGARSAILSVAFSQDGQFLASGSGNLHSFGIWKDNTIRIYHLATQKIVHVLSGHTGWIPSLNFSQDGKFLASGSEDGTVRLWDTQTWQNKQIIKIKFFLSCRIHTVIFSPNSRFLAVGTEHDTVYLWDLHSERIIDKFCGYDAYSSIAFSLDGYILAIALKDGGFILWDIQAHRKIFSSNTNSLGFSNPNCLVHSALNFSPNGQILAAGNSMNIELWDLKSLEKVGTLNKRQNRRQMSFSPNGKMLASGGLNKIIRLWDLDTGKEICVLRGHSGQIMDIIFSPDGKTMASSSLDRTIKLWGMI